METSKIYDLFLYHSVNSDVKTQTQFIFSNEFILDSQLARLIGENDNVPSLTLQLLWKRFELEDDLDQEYYMEYILKKHLLPIEYIEYINDVIEGIDIKSRNVPKLVHKLQLFCPKQIVDDLSSKQKALNKLYTKLKIMLTVDWETRIYLLNGLLTKAVKSENGSHGATQMQELLFLTSQELLQRCYSHLNELDTLLVIQDIYEEFVRWQPYCQEKLAKEFRLLWEAKCNL